MEISLYSIFPLLSSLFILFLGFFVYIKQSRSPINRAYSRFSVFTFIWLFSYAISYSTITEQHAFFWLKVGYTGIILIPVGFSHFVYAFLNLKSHKKILIFLYGISFLFIYSLYGTDYFVIGLYKYFWGYYPKVGFLHPLYLGFLFLTVGYCDFLLFINWFKMRKESTLFKSKIQYVLSGFFIGFLSCVDFVPNYNLEIYPFGWFTVILGYSFIAYGILRYRLMDIYVYIKRTMAYSLAAGFLMGFFVMLVFAVTKYLSGLIGMTSFTIVAIAAFIIALLFNPLRNRIQTIIDKTFYKKTYDYYSTLQKVSHELASTFNLKRIYGFIGDTISSALGLKNIYLLSLFPDEKYRMVYLTTSEKKDEIKNEKAVNIDRESSVREYNIENRIQESEGIINGKSEMVKLLKKSKDVVIREELPQIREIKQEVVDKVNTDLKPFKGEAVVPIFIDSKLEFMIVLGEKLSGDIFTSEDIKLLQTISDQTAIAVKNARLYIDKLRSDRLASIGMISATFAHEIKNPLTSIKTFAQLLPERHSDTEFRENFSRIVIDGVNRIDGLIKDLLDFSSGKISVEMSTLNVTGLMDNIINEVVTQLQLKNKKISIEKDYENIEVNMSGDGKRLRQAFANIILNGCQAIPDTRDDGKIRVSINPVEENVGITIADNGDGIPLEDVLRIFEPFFSTKTIGAGLGLAITKKIIEDHYGKIEVDSILKKGTTFRITLPVKGMGAKVGNLSTA